MRSLFTISEAAWQNIKQRDSSFCVHEETAGLYFFIQACCFLLKLSKNQGFIVDYKREKKDLSREFSLQIPVLILY